MKEKNKEINKEICECQRFLWHPSRMEKWQQQEEED